MLRFFRLERGAEAQAEGGKIARPVSAGNQYFSYFRILACIPVSIES